MSKLPDLQAAVRRIEGVASATVRWPDPHGPATLRVEFARDADRAVVTEQVIAALQDIAGVDVEDIRLDMHPGGDEDAGALFGQPDQPDAAAPSAEPQATQGSAPVIESRQATVTTMGARGRPVFSGMRIDGGDLDTRVHVTLAVGDRAYTGQAEGLATRRATPRTAAGATIDALRELLPSHLRVELEWIDLLEATEPGRPAIVQAAVTCLSRAAENVYIGTAIVRTDLREAAVRATLDALNRQLFRSHDEEPVSVPA